MKKRRGRRSFWWWSWLLVLATIGGVVGGYMYGEKVWEKAPKDYVSSATLTFYARPPFVGRGLQAPSETSPIADANETAVMQDAFSIDSLQYIINELELSQKWTMSAEEAMTFLRDHVELVLQRDKRELYVVATLPDPVDSALVANAFANSIPDRIKLVDDRLKSLSENKLESERVPYVTAEREAREELQELLEAKDYRVPLEPGVDLGAYLFDEEIRDAHLRWETELDNHKDIVKDQSEYSKYWERSVKPTFVTQKAIAPANFSGPEVKPFQTEWALYGLTGGLLAGVLLMVIFWKILP